MYNNQSINQSNKQTDCLLHVFSLQKRHQSWSLYYRAKRKKIKPEKKGNGIIRKKEQKNKNDERYKTKEKEMQSHRI